MIADRAKYSWYLAPFLLEFFFVMLGLMGSSNLTTAFGTFLDAPFGFPMFVYFGVVGVSMIIAYVLRSNLNLSKNVLRLAVALAFISSGILAYGGVTGDIIGSILTYVALTPFTVYVIIAKTYWRLYNHRYIALILGLAMLGLTAFLVWFFWPTGMCCGTSALS